MSKSGAHAMPGAIKDVFVTSDYIGGLRGDPAGGATRCVLQSTGGSTFWCGGGQRNGSALTPYWDKVGAVGFFDYGGLGLARTLGVEGGNQVTTTNGRHVLVGWIGSSNAASYCDGCHAASQSLARDLTLSPDFELLQQFVPELTSLRVPDTMTQQHQTGGGDKHHRTRAPPALKGSLQLEIVVKFEFDSNPAGQFGVTFLNGAANVTVDCTTNHPAAPDGCMLHNVMAPRGFKGGPDGFDIPVLPVGHKSIRVHTIVDHELIEAIVNNRSAMFWTARPFRANDTAVSLFGVGGSTGVNATITTWNLKSANNL